MSAAENVIGTILVGGKDAYWSVADILRAEDFPTPLLANLFRICGEVAKSAADLDVFSVGNEAERRGVMDGRDVVGLAAETWNTSNLRSHAELVKSDAIARRVRAICAEGAKTGDVATVQGELTSLLNGQPTSAVHASVAVKAMWDDVVARHQAGDSMTGIPTGIPLVDEWTGGLQPGRVYGVGARAKMGKTVLAMGVCAFAALEKKIPTAIWSLEMTKEELMQRMACAVSGVPGMALQRPRLLDSLDEGWSKLTVAVKALRDAPLYISDRTDVTIEQVESQARQMRASGQLELLCIDYLGLLRMPKMDRHDLSVAHVTRRIKIIAKELRIPVLLVFQLNRGSENGMQVRPPRPSDARDSGAIEQDLDAMFLLHRPSYYDKAAAKGLRLDLALQRNGQTGLIEMNDELHCCRFTGGAREWTDLTPNRGGRDDDL
jgi:replicative DNA helicase